MGQISLREEYERYLLLILGFLCPQELLLSHHLLWVIVVVADLLLVLNNIELIILSTLIHFPALFIFPAIKRDIRSHEDGADFLAIVAAFCILGAANVVIKGIFG